MGRPMGKPNAKPTKLEIGYYYRALKAAADKGDTMAAGLLLLNDTANRYVVLHEKPEISLASAMGLAHTAILKLPRSEWHVLPEEVQDLADTLLRKGIELARKEQREEKERGEARK